MRRSFRRKVLEQMVMDHRTQWKSPERPEWVASFNAEMDCMEPRATVPLDEDSLINAAKASTGLSDFGSDEWREPFRIFVKSLEEEADLNLLGRLRTRRDVIYLLMRRLQIEEAYRRHPEIAE